MARPESVHALWALSNSHTSLKSKTVDKFLIVAPQLSAWLFGHNGYKTIFVEKQLHYSIHATENHFGRKLEFSLWKLRVNFSILSNLLCVEHNPNTIDQLLSTIALWPNINSFMIV